MRDLLPLALILAMSASAHAVGGDDPIPPKPTPTTTECAEDEVHDDETKACVKIESGALGDDALYGAVRELAYAGLHDRASAALDAMSDQGASRVLTYRGFLARKAGDPVAADRAYRAALAADPSNLLARSYMGQGLAAAGRMAEARAQLIEIRMRGGRGSWAEAALATAIETGRTADY